MVKAKPEKQETMSILGGSVASRGPGDCGKQQIYNTSAVATLFGSAPLFPRWMSRLDIASFNDTNYERDLVCFSFLQNRAHMQTVNVRDRD